MTEVLLTGGTGFVGSAVVERLKTDDSYRLRLALRSSSSRRLPTVSTFHFGNLDAQENWEHGLAGVDVVIHCAARVHVMNDTAADPLVEFRKANVDGTLRLASQAAAAAVKRFVFVSSIKVNGEGTQLGYPYTADDIPAPRDAYGLSKYEAERRLFALAAETGMEVVVIRPVLVYGPGVKANFRSMMNWLCKGAPLPLGAIHNQRSLVALDNLVDLIVTCIDHPNAANQIFLVSDGEDLSTTDLLRRMGQALGRPARLLPVPAWMLEKAATMLGKRSVSQRLCGSLQVDISKTLELLEWSPPVSVDEALRKTAGHFLEHQRK